MPIPPAPPAWFGPLPVKTQAALSNLGLLLEPDSARLLAPKERLLQYDFDIANNALFHGETGRYVYDDSEWHTVRVTWGWGQSGQSEWRAQLTALERTGGVLDPILRFWHSAIIPFRDPGFKSTVQQQVQTQLVDGATQVNLNGTARALASLTLTYKRALGRGLAVRAVVKAPLTGTRRYLDNGAVDGGIGLLGESALSPRFALHTNLNAVRAGTTTVGGLSGGQRWLTGLVVAAEWKASARDHLILQTEDSGFPFLQGARARADRRQQMSFGAWRQVSPQWRVHASFSENIYPFLVTSFTPDVMFSLGATRRW